MQGSYHVDDFLAYCGRTGSWERLVAYEASGAK